MITKMRNALKYFALLLFFSSFSNISISRAQNENLTSDELFRQGEYFEQIKDYKQAMSCFFKSAKKNNTKAQHKIASFYEYGIGVKKDYITASKWYTKAAEQGDLISLKKLEKLTFLMEEDFAITETVKKTSPPDQANSHRKNTYETSTEIKRSVTKQDINTKNIKRSKRRDTSVKNSQSYSGRGGINEKTILPEVYLFHYLHGFIGVDSMGKDPALQFAWARMGAALTCNIELNQRLILFNLSKVYSLNRSSKDRYSSNVSNLHEIDPIIFHHSQSKKIAAFCSNERKIEVKKEIAKLENGFLPKKYYLNEGIEIPPNFRQ